MQSAAVTEIRRKASRLARSAAVGIWSAEPREYRWMPAAPDPKNRPCTMEYHSCDIS